MPCHLIQKFPQTIKFLCQAYGVDLLTLDFDKDLLYLKLEFPKGSGFMPLVIETLSNRRISIAHYYEQNGDLIADPDVVCYVLDSDHWSPLSIQHPPPFGFCKAAEITEDGRISYNLRKQKDIGSFTSSWASNIRAQEWFLKGNKPNPEITVTATINGQVITGNHEKAQVS